MVAANSSSKRHDDHKKMKKQGVKSVKKVLEGINMGIRQVSEGGGKVFTRERHGYGFVGGDAVFVPFSGRCSLVTFLGEGQGRRKERCTKRRNKLEEERL